MSSGELPRSRRSTSTEQWPLDNGAGVGVPRGTVTTVTTAMMMTSMVLLMVVAVTEMRMVAMMGMVVITAGMVAGKVNSTEDV